jgi:uncharacterized OsmC-like protein
MRVGRGKKPTQQRREERMPDLKIVATNIAPTVFTAKVRGHVIVADIPEEKGGTDLAPMPPELMLASLAMCFGMVAALHCRDRGLPHVGMTVAVSADKIGKPGEQERWGNIKLHVRFPEELPPERIEAIMRHAKLACSVRGTLTAGGEVEVTACSGEDCPVCSG